MKTMDVGFFKTNCLKLMDDVQAKRETVMITERGKPVAKLMPVNAVTEEIYGFLTGKGSIAGDMISPVLSAPPKAR